MRANLVYRFLGAAVSIFVVYSLLDAAGIDSWRILLAAGFLTVLPFLLRIERRSNH